VSSSIRLRTADISLATSCLSGRAQAAIAQDKICVLKELVMELHLQLESFNQVPTPAVEQGIDFYNEVSHFEIEMIKRALRFTEGHQGRAAQLLNLKTTTLGAMIKRHNNQKHDKIGARLVPI